MILKWLHRVVHSTPITNGGEQPLTVSKLVDVAHEVLSKEALEKQEALKGFERYGWPFVKRRHFKERVRAKIKRLLGIPHSETDPTEDMVEEITERITEVAEVDPYYRKMFDDGEKEI